MVLYCIVWFEFLSQTKFPFPTKMAERLYRGIFQKIYSQEETDLPNVLALLGKLIGLVYHNIVAKLWRGVAVAV